jgi:hypothetical protein
MSEPVTIERLERALALCARLVVLDGPVVIPLFESLERDLAAARARRRAREAAARKLGLGLADGGSPMKKYEDLHINDQLRLSASVIQLLGGQLSADDKVRTIETVAETLGVTVDEVWRDICADSGLDARHPWKGYPATPPRTRH